MQEPKVLLIEDEEPISILIKYNMEKSGFRVFSAINYNLAIEEISKNIPDLLIVDWMLPEKSGVEIIKEFKTTPSLSHIPVIMLTARSQEADKLKGFELGVDDYLTKPFSPKELIARAKSVLKRANPTLMQQNIFYKNIEIDNAKKLAKIDGKKIELTNTEFYLLSYMVARPEKVHSRENLLNHVWDNPEEIEGRAVDVCIRRIRAALEATSQGMQDVIKTVRGEGYSLEI
jgi:two-component system phosphate regulon response regulator PhoB